MRRNGHAYRFLAKLKLSALDRSGFYWLRSKFFHRFVVRCSEPRILRTLKPYVRQVEIRGPYHSSNPSIVAHNGAYLGIVRTINYRLVRNGWFVVEGRDHDTKNYIVHLDGEFKIKSQMLVADSHERNRSVDAFNGFEDLRIFFWKSQVWALGNASNFNLQQSSMVLQRISGGKVVESHLLKSPFGQKREKNWMPFVHDDRLFAVYSVTPFIVLEISDGSCLVKIEKDLGFDMELFGSSQILQWRSGWICVVHERDYVNLIGRLYRHRFLYIDKNWGVTLSEPFCWKDYGVEFCCGLAFQNGKFAAAVSVHDRKAFFVELDEDLVNSMLNGIF